MPPLYGLSYSDAALEFLASLQPKIRRQVVNKVNTLAQNAIPPGSKVIRGLTDDEEPVHRIRSGDYRILYVVRDVMIAILDIDHRKDVYR